MGCLRVTISRVDEQNEDRMTELASFDMPEVDVGKLKAETALDELENSTYEQGQNILRRLLKAKWEEIDESMVARYSQDFSPGDAEEGRA
jgi:hypothetical protein